MQREAEAFNKGIKSASSISRQILMVFLSDFFEQQSGYYQK
ncbi:hypothetical protein ACUCAM_000798 [Pluralibacter gergoviae]